jgi:hypothetical protein
MVVVTTKLYKAIPMVGANACAALETYLAGDRILLHLFFPCYVVSSKIHSRYLRSLRAIGTLLAHFKDAVEGNTRQKFWFNSSVPCHLSSKARGSRTPHPT